MNAIMLSVQPKWLAKILNGEKTIEIRKSIPKDLPTPFVMYLYCTKGKDYVKTGNRMFECSYVSDGFKPFIVNGKVVAKCVVEKIEKLTEFHYADVDPHGIYRNSKTEECREGACLSCKEMNEYANYAPLYALHLTQLEIFDKPRELGEFSKLGSLKYAFNHAEDPNVDDNWYEITHITKAPQSWCYIESEEK